MEIFKKQAKKHFLNFLKIFFALLIVEFLLFSNLNVFNDPYMNWVFNKAFATLIVTLIIFVPIEYFFNKQKLKITIKLEGYKDYGTPIFFVSLKGQKLHLIIEIKGNPKYISNKEKFFIIQFPTWVTVQPRRDDNFFIKNLQGKRNILRCNIKELINKELVDNKKRIPFIRRAVDIDIISSTDEENEQVASITDKFSFLKKATFVKLSTTEIKIVNKVEGTDGIFEVDRQYSENNGFNY